MTDPGNPLEPVAGGPRRVKPDLAVRSLSAAVMIILTLGALWLGGWAFRIFCFLVAAGLLFEYLAIVRRFGIRSGNRTAWGIFGMLLIGASMSCLLVIYDLRGLASTLVILGSVWAVDIGAYFAGRTFGGPKIARSISPSKTWAGLFGGMVGATLWLFAAQSLSSGIYGAAGLLWFSPAIGPLIAIISQMGDFFESWMKRRAGVKDSGALIPGHGGLFDRLDGLMPVLIFVTALLLIS